MKIMIINHEFPPIGGGGAYACKYLAGYLAERGDQVKIVTSSFNNVSPTDSEDKYKVRRILGIRKSLYAGRIAEVIIFVIHGFFYFLTNFKERPDVVYAFFSLPSGLLGLFIKKIYKVPYCVFLRGVDVPGSCGGRFYFLNRVLRPLIRYIWLNADKVIANSQALKDLAGKTLKDRPIYVIPNMVDTNFFSPSERIRNENRLKIIYAGRLDKQKGLGYLFESFALLSKDIFELPVYLEIVGDGPQKKDLLKKSDELNISENIVFAGWVDKTALSERYRNADIYVSVSLDEGMPNTVMEAMACGLPIVASDIPAHKELIQHGKNGMLVPTKDSQKLADAIKTLIENKSLRENMGKENIKTIQRYSLHNISKYLEVLRI